MYIINLPRLTFSILHLFALAFFFFPVKKKRKRERGGGKGIQSNIHEQVGLFLKPLELTAQDILSGVD